MTHLLTTIDPAMVILFDVATFLSVAFAITCLIIYQVQSRGAWRMQRIGRHLVATTAAIGSTLLLILIRILMHGHDSLLFRDLQIVVFLGIPAVLGHRIYIILTVDREEERS